MPKDNPPAPQGLPAPHGKSYNSAAVVEVGSGIRMRQVRLTVVVAVSVIASACSTRAPVPAIPVLSTAHEHSVEVGVASWYGPGFNGHATASGEIYDQRKLTAAANDFALGSHVLVTNLNNGKSVEVRINDRGPFCKGRKIDLSHEAAKEIGMIGPGTAPVRIEVVKAPAQAPPVGEHLYWVQCGSYLQQGRAESVRRRLLAHYSDVHVHEAEVHGRPYYRVWMGAFHTRSEARQWAAAASRMGLAAMVIGE